MPSLEWLAGIRVNVTAIVSFHNHRPANWAGRGFHCFALNHAAMKEQPNTALWTKGIQRG
jgi:hypothetical protein